MDPYRLTPRMLQHLERSLRKYHDLFSGGRCQSWELEELLVNAIKSDTQAHHHVIWREAGHDFEADMEVRTNGHCHFLQVKSGQIKNNRELGCPVITISGHRLTRFGGDLARITDFLRTRTANILTVPYRKVDGATGRKHLYRVAYIDSRYLTAISESWECKGQSFRQKNQHDVIFSLQPTMSWQIWWKIPIRLMAQTPEMEIG